MPKLTVPVPVLNEEETLPKTLDSLIHQTVEDFEVILLDGGSTDGSLALEREAVDQYVGFYLIAEPFANRYEALNRGFKAAEGNYIMVLSARDYLTDESVEELLKFLDEAERKPDIVTFRNYYFGETQMDRFGEYEDLLAPVPQIGRFENPLLRILHLRAKAFRKAFLENHHLEFVTDTPFADTMFVYRALCAAKKIAGCPCAVYETRIRGYLTPPPAEEQDHAAYFTHFVAAWDSIYDAAAELVGAESSMAIDGSESYLQETVYTFITELYTRFYTRLWFLDDDTYRRVIEIYNQRVRLLDAEKMKRLQTEYAWLAAPYVFGARDSVEYFCTLALKFANTDDYELFLRSAYRQTFPFFEVIVDHADADGIPEGLREMPNLRVVESNDFFAAARQIARSRMVLIVKDAEPMDVRVLQELRGSKAPLVLRQSAFARIRKALKLKSSLKQKGMNIK